MNAYLATWSPKILSVLRFVAGFLILWHGSQKLFGFPPKSGGGGDGDPLILVAGILEFFGGVLLVLGLFTRWTAFILSGLMAVAYFMVHQPKGILPLQNGGELAVILCFVYFFLFFAGGGEWSLDRLIFKDKR